MKAALTGLVAAALIGSALAIASVQRANAQATAGPTRQIDTVTIAGPEAILQKRGVRSHPFRADARDGPVWLVYYFIGDVEGADDDAEVVFEMFLDGVQMDARDTFALFRARYMQQVREQDVAAQAPGTPIPLAAWAGMPSVPDALALALGPEAALRVTGDPQAYGRLRHIVVTQRLPVPAGEDTFASFSLRRARGFKPLYLRVHIGQGPVPRELEQWGRQTSGSWLYRYRSALLMVGAFVAAGLVLLRYLLRRA